MQTYTRHGNSISFAFSPRAAPARLLRLDRVEMRFRHAPAAAGQRNGRGNTYASEVARRTKFEGATRRPTRKRMGDQFSRLGNYITAATRELGDILILCEIAERCVEVLSVSASILLSPTVSKEAKSVRR